MFLGFLLFLRAGGFKVSMHDWLALAEGLQAGLHGQSMRGFYILCRALLVKSESDLTAVLCPEAARQQAVLLQGSGQVRVPAEA